MLLLVSGTYYVAEATNGLVVGCGGWTIENHPGADILIGEPYWRQLPPTEDVARGVFCQLSL